jgi:antitoxin component YwqK of YwqJK toxin-antitoxin module
MKQKLVLISLIVMLLSGCSSNNSTKNNRTPGEPYTEFEGTQANGVKKIYNAFGNLETEIPYKDSLPNGIQKEYYKTGKLYRETPLEKGKPNGLVKEYYSSGKLYREMPVINGKASGIVKKYYESGALLSEAPYENGEPTVGLKEYSEKGVLFEKAKMIFKGIDRTASEGAYIIEISFSDEYIQPTYSNILMADGKEVLNKIPIVNGKGVYKIYIPKGTILNKKITFEARYNTIRKNIYVTRDSYTIGITNF